MTNSNPQVPGNVPQFTMGDRLRKARESASLDMKEIAALIDIHRQSVARYEQDAAVPRRHVLLSWSVATGVDLGWILSGEQSTQVEQTSRTTDSEFKRIQSSKIRGIPRIFAPIDTEEYIS